MVYKVEGLENGFKYNQNKIEKKFKNKNSLNLFNYLNLNKIIINFNYVL